jgi:hypothetical protein
VGVGLPSTQREVLLCCGEVCWRAKPDQVRYRNVDQDSKSLNANSSLDVGVAVGLKGFSTGAFDRFLVLSEWGKSQRQQKQ